MSTRSPYNSLIKTSSSSLKDIKFGEDKSPCCKDRFLGSKSPIHYSSQDNYFLQDESDSSRKSSSTPRSPFSKKPMVNSRLFDAPGVSLDFPNQIVDSNESGNLAISLDSTVYIMPISSENNAVEFATLSTNISALSWVENNLVISGNGYVELWDVTTSKPIRSFEMHEGNVGAISCFETRIATGGADGFVKIYDNRCPTTKTSGHIHSGDVSGLKWSPDGLTLATSGIDGIVSLIGNQNLKKKKIIHDGPVRGLTWADGSILYSGEMSDEGTIRKINTKSNEEIDMFNTLLPIVDLGWNNEYGLISAHNDKYGTWSLFTPDLHRIMDLAEHRGGIINACIPRYLSSFATVSSDESFRIWDFSPSKSPLKSPSRSPLSSQRVNFQEGNSPHIGKFSSSPFGSTIFSLR